MGAEHRGRDVPEVEKVHKQDAAWKDHPLAVAAISAAATIGLSVMVFTQIVMPTITASQADDIKRLKDGRAVMVSSQKDTLDKYEKLRVEFDKAKSDLEELTIELRDARAGSLFGGSSPYPIGLGRIRVGDPASRVAEIYGHEVKGEIDDGYYEVKLSKSYFKEVVYYFDGKSNITHIMFAMDLLSLIKDKNTKFLFRKLTDAFGSPREWSGKGFYSWDVDGVQIYMSDEYSYVVMHNGFAPGYWPKQ